MNKSKLSGEIRQLESERTRIEHLSESRQAVILGIENRKASIASHLARLILPDLTDDYAVWINGRLRVAGAELFPGASLVSFIAAEKQRLNDELQSLERNLKIKTAEAEHYFSLKNKHRIYTEETALARHLLLDWVFDKTAAEALLELYLARFGTEDYRADRWSARYWRHRLLDFLHNLKLRAETASGSNGPTLLSRLTELMQRLDAALEKERATERAMEEMVGAWEDSCRISFEINDRKKLLESYDEDLAPDVWQDKLAALLASSRELVCRLNWQIMPKVYSKWAVENINAEFGRLLDEQRLLESMTYDFALLQEDLAAVSAELTETAARLANIGEIGDQDTGLMLLNNEMSGEPNRRRLCLLREANNTNTYAGKIFFDNRDGRTRHASTD